MKQKITLLGILSALLVLAGCMPRIDLDNASFDGLRAEIDETAETGEAVATLASTESVSYVDEAGKTEGWLNFEYENGGNYSLFFCTDESWFEVVREGECYLLDFDAIEANKEMNKYSMMLSGCYTGYLEIVECKSN